MRNRRPYVKVQFCLLICCFLLTGCVSHALVSDSIMFKKGETDQKESSKSTISQSFTSDLGPFFSLDARAYLQDQNDRIRRSVALRNVFGFSYTLSNTIEMTKYNNAISFSLGFGAIGADITQKLSRNHYLSAGFSNRQNIQAYYQYKLLETAKRGVAIGLGYQRLSFTFEEVPEPCESPCSGPFFPPLLYDTIDTFGFRAFTVSRKLTESNLRVGIYVGYAPYLNRTIVRFNIINLNF